MREKLSKCASEFTIRTTANQSDSIKNLLARSKAQRHAVDELTIKMKQYTLNYKKLSEQTDRRLKELSE